MDEATLLNIFEPKKRSPQDKDTLNPDEIWSLIQVASHPHSLSLYNIVRQLYLQHEAIPKFLIDKPLVPYTTADLHDGNNPNLNKISVASLQTLFELLRQIHLTNPELVSSVLLTTCKSIDNLPQKSFLDDSLNSDCWISFLEEVSKTSSDPNTFNVLLCTAILQNKADNILSALQQTLKGHIKDVQMCKVLTDLQDRSLVRYKADKQISGMTWWTSPLNDPVVSFDTTIDVDSETFNMKSEGTHVYVYNNGDLYKFSTGLGGTVQGKCLKKAKISACTQLRLISAAPRLLAVKTAKTRSLVEINKTTLTIEKTFKLDLSRNNKCFVDKDRVLIGSGSWSNVTISELDITTTPPATLSTRHVSVTNPGIFVFGSSLCDSEKQCHPIVTEDVEYITGTESFTIATGIDHKLMFRGNADEIGTGQGLIDKWIEISVGGINKFISIACPHQEKYAVMVSEDGKPYIAGHFKKGVDGDSSKPKKKPAPSKPKLIDRIKDKVVICAAGDTTSAFITECGQLYMFGSLATPFDSNGLVPQFSVLSVQDVTLGHNHASILTKTGQVYTMGANSLAQCGRNYIPNPDSNPEDDESDSDDGMCDPGTHVWRNILCMICFFCGECTGYGQGCCRNGEPGRDPGLECGCGAGDSGCSICGCCKSCAKEAQVLAKKNPKFKPKNDPKPLRFESDEEESSQNDSVSEEEEEEEEEDAEEYEEHVGKAHQNGGLKANTNGDNDTDGKSVNPAELTKLPAPVKTPGELTVTQVSCGLHHTAMVLSNGEVWGFGSNTSGQLGMGSISIVQVPTKIENIEGSAGQVACGSTHTVVLANHQVFSCGKYLDGQLGRCPSDFCKVRKSDSNISSKAWYSNMALVPGFGLSESRHVVSISAVGNRTFVKCRKPLMNNVLQLEDNVEIIMDKEKFIIVVPDKDSNLCFLTDDEHGRWRSQETQLKTKNCVSYDDIYKTVWIADKETGVLSGYTSYGSQNNSKTDPMMMRESLLPYSSQNIDKESACYAVLSHLTTLCNPTVTANCTRDVTEEESSYSYCNRFPSFGGGWGYSGKSIDAILFTAEQDILLHGIGLYGGRGNYSAKLKVYDIGYGGPEPDDGDLIFEMPTFNYTCKPKDTHQVFFDEAIQISSGSWYRIILKVEGPSSDCGNSGKREVISDGVKFIFRSSKRSTNGTDYGSGQIPQLIYKKCVVDEDEKKKRLDEQTDMMPLGNWLSGFTHLLCILKICFTHLHTHLKSKTTLNSMLHKSTMSLDLLKTDALVSSDPVLKSLDSKLCVAISMVDIYLAVSSHNPDCLEKDKLLRECQDILSAILKLELPETCLVVKKSSKVYSKHFHLFYASPQHYWAAFLSVHNAYKKDKEQNKSILSTVLQAMCYQGDTIANELFHYGTVAGLIAPNNSAMSLGSQEDTTHDIVDVEYLNNMTYKRALTDVIGLTMSDSYNVGHMAQKLIKTILQQIVLASMGSFGPLSIAANKETSSRFASVSLKAWNSKSKSLADAITFKISQSNVFLSGVGLYQTVKDSSCDIEILVKDCNNKWKAVFNHSGQLKRAHANAHVNRVLFKKPFKLKPDVQYSIKVQQFCGSVLHGTSTNPLSFVTGPDGVSFTYYDCPLSLSGTDLKHGQIPFLIYKTQLNQEIHEEGGDEKYETITLQILEMISATFVKVIDKTHLNVPEAWAEDTVDEASDEDFTEKLPDFIINILSYTQLILLNKNAPKTSYLLLDNILKPLLTTMSDYNLRNKLKREEDAAERVIVESEHPYPEATVLHYQAILSPDVTWMVAEFAPESGVGPDDSLQIYIPASSNSCDVKQYLSLENKDGKAKPILKLGPGKDWPKRALLLPGNKVSFMLKSTTKVNKQQMNDSVWGFSCKIVGYKYKKRRRTLAQLEHIVADLAGICIRVMISPSNTSHHLLSQDGQYAFKAHAKLLGRGLYLNSLPSYSALKKRTFLEEEPNELTFLKGFIAGTKLTSGGRLALWLDPTEEMNITKAHIEIGIYDGEDKYYSGTLYPVVCCTMNDNDDVIFPLGAKIGVSLMKIECEDERDRITEPDTSFEENRYNISQNLRLPTVIDAKSYNNGFYSISWQPSEPGLYHLAVLVDGVNVGGPVEAQVVERTKPMIRTKKSEQLLEKYKKRKIAHTDTVATPEGPVEYEVVKSGSAGHTIRGAMSTSSPPLGLIAMGQCVQITSTVQSSEGIWGLLTDKSKDTYCTTKTAVVYTLLSSPFNTYLALTGASSSDPNEVYILRTISRQDNLSETVVFDHGTPAPSTSKQDKTVTADSKSEYSIAFASDTSIVENIDIKCVNSRSLTSTIRTVFAAYLWHYGAVHDAMAAAAYIKFENHAESGNTEDSRVHQSVKRNQSLPFKMKDPPKHKAKEENGTSSVDRKKRTSSYSSQKAFEADEANSHNDIDVKDVSSLKMLCTLWDSVKELIMTCATTKIKPPPPITEDTNKDNSKPKKKRSKRNVKVQFSEGDKEQCELCGEQVTHPVTYHMSKHHPGCKSNCGGMGYNSKGIYCSGWSGLCGEGGKGLSTWYLLCTECVETAKQEPLPTADTTRDNAFPIDPAASLPSVNTMDLEEQLINTYNNARFLLTLAPIVETSRPENMDYETFMEEAMDTDMEPARNKFRSLQQDVDLLSQCLSPMTPIAPNAGRFPGAGPPRRPSNKMVRSLSVNILPSSTKDSTHSLREKAKSQNRPKSAAAGRGSITSPLSPLPPISSTVMHIPPRRNTHLVFKSASLAGLPRLSKSEPKTPNILHNPSAQLVKLATVISLDRGWLFGFMSQKQPLLDLEEELIRGVEKAWSISKGLLAADWLLRTVSSLPILHSVLWRLYMGLLSDPNSDMGRQKEGLLPICQHPITSSIKCYDNCVSAAFRTVMQSLSDLLPRLPAGSDVQKVAISCWNLEFRPEDHKFLQDSQVFSHIHRLLTSASRRDLPTHLPNFQKSADIDCELTASSRDALIPYLTDKKTDTFWESGDKENWVSIKLPADKQCHAVALYLNNEEDRGFITTKISIKVGNVPKVLKAYTSRDISPKYAGWLWFEVTGYTHIEIELTAKKDHVRVRQLLVFGEIVDIPPTSTIPTSQQYALQVFRVLTNDILKNITKDESDPVHTSADLQEHLVSILFEQSHLTATQNKVLLHVVNAIRKQATAITDKTTFNDDYCFELLSLVSALSGSAAGCFNLVVHDVLIQDVLKLLHLGTTRIQRQVTLLLRRILTQITPVELCTITNTSIPKFPFDQDEENSVAEHKRTVLNNLLAYIMKSIKLIVKSKGKRSHDEYTQMKIEHTDYWVHGTVEKSLAHDVMNLLKDMVNGNLGSEWQECARSCLSYLVFSLTNIPEDHRTEEKLSTNRNLWLALAALSVMDETLMSSVTVEKDSGSVEYCENHDDERTKALVSCSKCGFLCVECDKYLHLSKKSKSHQRQLFKAAEASIVLNKHDNMCRAKLYWLMCVVDTQSSKAVIEFRNSYSTQTDGLICRFCNEVGEPHPEGGVLCKNEDCNAKFKISCKKLLCCGHPCNGNVGEENCLPCLKNCTEDIKQDADDMCVICFTESLGCAPCLQLQCGHILHTVCVERIIKNSWLGPRISFNFIGCPICKTTLAHHYLDDLLKPILVLKEDVEQKSVMRLKYDGISFETEVEAVEYAMNKYAYYKCFKCNKAYFGGEAQCQADAGDEFDPEDLVCGGCSNVSQEICPKHGSDYLEYKCRYCCSVAVFFCFGSTHFCTPCHDDFVRLRSLKKDTLPSCPVGPKSVQLEGVCPLGVDHPTTGEEFALGCGVCRNIQTF